MIKYILFAQLGTGVRRTGPSQDNMAGISPGNGPTPHCPIPYLTIIVRYVTQEKYL
jgi:hypothetical protein